MIKLLILSLLSTLLIAQNPKVYSALGDVIYNNVENIEKLKNITYYSEFEEKIDSYVKDVYKAKDIGYEIESGNKKVDKKQYLQTIRQLSKINDFFYRLIVKSYKSSIIDQDNLFFSKIINSGMIDTKKNKDEILEYYFAHSYDMNSSGVIQKYLDEDKKLKQKQTVSKKQTLSKKQIQDAKIKRIREKDKAKQESIQKTLEDELIKKKSDIRKEQVEELTKSN